MTFSRSASEPQPSASLDVESTPLVSVVTPFYNTAAFLAECIESVLLQTYQNWEYILVNNSSTDGSREIAEQYATRFPGKIRVVHTPSFLTQVQNYNFALSQIHPDSKYCKMVQADDWIFPDCLRSMVHVAEAHPSVAIVSAYELEGNVVSLDGLPYPSTEVSGREVARLFFLQRYYLFGTPTSLLMRSEVIRSRAPFYDESLAPFEDAHVCFELLKTWNFGFVHQVLTFSRRDNESILLRIRFFGPLLFSRLALVVVHGREFLSDEEYSQCLRDAQLRYFLFLGKAALRRKRRDFWEFHRSLLPSIGYSLDWKCLSKSISLALFDYVGNPKRTVTSFCARRRKTYGALRAVTEEERW